MGSFITIIMNIFAAIANAVFGTDKPQAKTVRHAEREVTTHDGKADADRLRDLGL